MRVPHLPCLLAVLATAPALAQAPPAGDATRGEAVFRAQCITCHSVTPGQASPIGPHLFGVVGRRAGSLAGFNYTDALRRSEVTWTPVKLDHWLEFPHAVAPGTSMALIVPDAQNRSDVIAFLASRKAGKPEAAAKP